MSGHPPSDSERLALKAVVNLLRLSEPLIFELWRSHELTLAQVQCLRILSIQPEQAGDLAKRLSMSSTSLTRILERLESRQLVDRIVDVHDRRRIWVRLTEAGQQTVSSLSSWYATPLFQAIQAMNPVELAELTGVLNRFNQAVRVCENGPPVRADLPSEP
ncbi:MAG: MarR family transcriptional regulator [Sulfobacillus acidophilus]|uniref:MarR family transcriptional regulator n=1 Tax=Sulfobacillus acidophilus TaxID=53633 RepID=A0A2T2WKW5_9FIRM|nr:MAG: MarR family transcriptional regulator [Sulfobacillus acidophilus]